MEKNHENQRPQAPASEYSSGQSPQPSPAQSKQELPQYPAQSFQENPHDGQTTPPQDAKGKSFGIAALACGITGLVLAFIPFINLLSFPVVILGLIFGIISLVMGRGGQGPKGFGIAALICSGSALIVTAVVYFFIATALISYSGEALDYLRENIEVDSYVSGSALNKDLVVIDIEQDSDTSDDLFLHYTVTLENTSKETIEYVFIEIPLYDVTGHRLDSAYGSAARVGPGTFTIEATVFASESAEVVFNEEEVVITFLD